MRTITMPAFLNMFQRLFFLVFLSTLSPCSFAEQEVGEFKRIDGSVVRVMEEEYGSISYVGYECWFEMPDGKRIDAPLNVFAEELSCVAMVMGDRAEIYVFPYVGSAFPVATRVLQFDGYQFMDVTTPAKLWFSPLIHTGHYFVGYLVTIVIFSPFLFLGAALIRRTPANGWWLVLHAIWIILGAPIILAYVVLASLYGPYSPPVFIIILAIVIMLYRMVRKQSGAGHGLGKPSSAE